jgi:glutamate 5-kinase
MSSIYTPQNTKRVVVKVGTNVLTDDNSGFSQARLQGIVDQLSALWQAGHDVFLVTSGAVGLGKQALTLSHDLDLVDKQACAAVGQSLLMQAYQSAFQSAGITVAQVLLTAYDLANRQRYLNIKETFERLVAMRALPIINENDCVSVAELLEVGKAKSFGDNDMLSALVASKLDANMLVILTNVDGIYTKNPTEHTDAEKLRVVEGFDALKAVDSAGSSSGGRGGMVTKLKAAELATMSNVTTYICNGFETGSIQALFQADDLETLSGTLVKPKVRLSGKKRWVGFASGYEGVIVINECAIKALVEKNASLLPVGITNVIGDFAAEDVVSVQSENGHEIGRGIALFSANDVRRIQGAHSSTMATRLGRDLPPGVDVVIQRDDLVIFETLFESI